VVRGRQPFSVDDAKIPIDRIRLIGNLLEILNWLLRLIKRKSVKLYVSPQEKDLTKSFSHWIIAKEAIFNGLMARLGLGEEIMVLARKKILA
jgi:hypothetical protein